MAKPSEEYTAFDAAVGQILTVSKAELDARVKAHKNRPLPSGKKRGPKPKRDVPCAPDES
jgi:hypothetical protein